MAYEATTADEEAASAAKKICGRLGQGIAGTQKRISFYFVVSRTCHGSCECRKTPEHETVQ